MTKSEPSALKTLGILGGMSPESTADYYGRINTGVRTALGGHHSAPMQIFSANLADVFRWTDSGDYDALGDYLEQAALGLQAADAGAVIMACNTAHVVASRIEDALSIPFHHIADVLGEALQRDGISRIALLGSRITMGGAFYRGRLQDGYGIETMTPDASGRDFVHRVIVEELCFHEIRDESRETLAGITESLALQGAEAVVLGCTELCLLVDGERFGGLPVYDTTALHVDRAVDVVLGRGEGELQQVAA